MRRISENTLLPAIKFCHVQRWMAALAIAVFFAGCGQTDAPPVDTSGVEPKDTVDQTSDPDDDSESPALKLVVASWEETKEKIAAHRGKIVVLDLWSTWCAPCKREFPNLVALHNKYPDQLVCMSLNVNFAGIDGETPESNREDVLKFLTEQSANFENILCSDPDEKLFSTIELDSVPAVYVFDQQGNVAQRFDNTTHDGEEFTYQGDVIPLIEKLLASDGA